MAATSRWVARLQSDVAGGANGGVAQVGGALNGAGGTTPAIGGSSSAGGSTIATGGRASSAGGAVATGASSGASSSARRWRCGWRHNGGCNLGGWWRQHRGGRHRGVWKPADSARGSMVEDKLACGEQKFFRLPTLGETGCWPVLGIASMGVECFSRWTTAQPGPRSVQADTDIDILSVATSSNNQVVAGTWNGLYQFTPGGSRGNAMTPTGMPADTAVRSIAAIDTALYAGTVGDIYRSSDDGGTWKK